MSSRIASWISMAVATAAVGCSSRPARVAVPEYDPEQIGMQAVELFDENGDGSLSADEYGKAKSLASAVQHIDADGDKKLTNEEIAARIHHYQEHKAGLLAVTCTLVKAGRPVKGAKLTYEPEKFMGESITSAYGTTDDAGRTMMSIAKEHLPRPTLMGVRPGFYRVHVTLADGKEVANWDAGVEAGSGLLNNHSFSIP